MTKFASMAVIASLGLVSSGCFLLPGMGGGVDMAKSMAENSQAMYKVQLHDGAEVGQYFEYELAGGMKQWWGVTGMKDGKYVVEMRSDTGQGWITTAHICEADGTVTAAYVANYDPEAEELSEGHEMKVMDPPAPVDPVDGPEPETGNETITAAGKEWDCKWTKVGDAKSWMCDDAWFGKLIKSEYAGNVSMMLSAMGTDASLGLKWPGEGGE